MSALVADRRNYDKPAQLSVKAAADQLNELAKATLALTKRVASDAAGGNALAQKSLKAASRSLGEAVRILGPLPVGAVVGEVPRRNERATPVAAPTDTASAIENHLASLVRRGVLTESDPLCEKLGWTRQSLSKALKAQRIFFVERAGTRLFPAFFADPQYDRRQLEAVSKAMGPLPGGAKLQFFLSHRGSLGGKSVLEALQRGQKDKVIAAAHAFLEG